MDIQHSDIGCNKHRAIPAFQPVHLTQLYKQKMKNILKNYNFRWTTVHEEDEIMDNSIRKEEGGE